LDYDVALVLDVVRVEEKRLLEEARARGLSTLLVNVESEGFELGGEQKAPVALIRCISMYRSVYSASFLESSGGRAINSSMAILLAGDKALSLPLLRSARLPVPRTYLALSPEAALAFMAKASKPLIDKPPIGSWGRLVSLIDSDIAAKIVVEHREEIQTPQVRAHLIQEFVRTGGEDIRCFVVNREVVACMKRKAPKGEWRTNVALGSATEPYRPTDVIEEISIKSVEAVRADYASVDIGVDSETGEPYVFEVNGVPEFKALERTSGRNIAGAIIELVKK